MKLSTFALFSTLATTTALAAPFRILPVNTFLPVSSSPFTPGPHHQPPSSLSEHSIHSAEEVAQSIRDELNRIALVHHNDIGPGHRVGKEQKHRPCHGNNKHKGGEQKGGWPTMIGGWLDALEKYTGRGRGGHHAGGFKEVGQMTVIEPDGSRTIVHYLDHPHHHHRPAPKPSDIRPLRETMSLRIDEALDALKPEEAFFVAFVVGSGLGSLFAIWFKIIRLLIHRRKLRNARAAAASSSPPSTSSPPDYYHNQTLPPVWTPTAGSLLDKKESSVPAAVAVVEAETEADEKKEAVESEKA